MIRKSRIPELELIKGCIAGKPKHQECLYNTYSPKMFAICLRYANGYHNAEDILQEGFVKVFKNIHRFRHEGSFEGWMRRIFVNTAIEHYRKTVHMYPILEMNHAAGNIVHDQTIEQLQAQDLMELVMQLSPGYRTVFNLYVVEGYQHKEIAEMLGITEGTSKSQLARARYLLQKMVKELNKHPKEAYV